MYRRISIPLTDLLILLYWMCRETIVAYNTWDKNGMRNRLKNRVCGKIICCLLFLYICLPKPGLIQMCGVQFSETVVLAEKLFRNHSDVDLGGYKYSV